MTLKIDELSDIRAEKENLVESRYTGSVKEIQGASGEAYLHLPDNQWFFRAAFDKANDPDNWYRVASKSLTCNQTNGKIKANYLGTSSLLGLKKTGKAWFDEGTDSWMFLPQGSKEEFRVGEASLEFIRDKDLTTD